MSPQFVLYVLVNPPELLLDRHTRAWFVGLSTTFQGDRHL